MNKINYVEKVIFDYKKEFFMQSIQKPHDIQKALLYLNEHLFNPKCSVQNMKKVCNIREQNFSSRFKNYIGYSPKEYIVFHRINLVKQLLRNKKLQELTVNSIGFYLGYEKPSSFNIRFKQKTGITPGRWRRKGGSQKLI